MESYILPCIFRTILTSSSLQVEFGFRFKTFITSLRGIASYWFSSLFIHSSFFSLCRSLKSFGSSIPSQPHLLNSSFLIPFSALYTCLRYISLSSLPPPHIFLSFFYLINSFCSKFSRVFNSPLIVWEGMKVFNK